MHWPGVIRNQDGKPGQSRGQLGNCQLIEDYRVFPKCFAHLLNHRAFFRPCENYYSNIGFTRELGPQTALRLRIPAAGIALPLDPSQATLTIALPQGGQR